MVLLLFFMTQAYFINACGNDSGSGDGYNNVYPRFSIGNFASSLFSFPNSAQDLANMFHGYNPHRHTPARTVCLGKSTAPAS